MNYGLNDGVNQDGYEFQLINENLIINGEDLTVDNSNAYFSEKYWNQLKINDKVVIKHEIEETISDGTISEKEHQHLLHLIKSKNLIK